MAVVKIYFSQDYCTVACLKLVVWPVSSLFFDLHCSEKVCEEHRAGLSTEKSIDGNGNQILF